MNGRLLIQTLRWNRVKLAAIVVAAFAWGLLIPIIYVSFGEAFKDLADSGIIPSELMNFGSGSLFTLPGALTLGLQHPLAIAFLGLFAIGSTVDAVAGERERGTLEVLLARPISRRTLYVTLAVAVLFLLAVVLAALLAGQLTGIAINDLTNELDLGLLPLAYANGLLLWTAFAAFGLAASVSFDRNAPALGLSMAYLLVNYFLEILGSLWTDVAWTQEYSLFHQFQPGDILEGNIDPMHFVILGVAVVVPVIYSLILFPRRDLAAPA
ncbi:MAG TPA: ABC transporter permease subunit [Candidatus Dormibacteraeota bacterium]|nr:ABC transporter permease subunit [Candidatus Dormibacteraeota bacterium]